MTFNGQQATQNASMTMGKVHNQSVSFQQTRTKEQAPAAMPKIILYPMKLEFNTFTSKKSKKFDDSGKIMKRDAKRLII